MAITRAEAIPLLNFANLMAPVIIALCANSPVYANLLSPYCSGREAQHVLIHANEFRHGMPVRPFRDALDFVERVSQATYLIHREARQDVDRCSRLVLRERRLSLDLGLLCIRLLCKPGADRLVDLCIVMCSTSLV